MKRTGGQLMIDLLKSHDVDLVFGYPGGAILPFYDELHKSDIRHILVRHEQGAIHMAEGYARCTGKPGVVIVTSGPGATNIITGLCDAKMDSVPIFAITGQVPTSAIGSDAFQEADIYGISIPVTKYNALIKDVDQLSSIFKEAWHICLQGRPGPVLIDLPKDIQLQETSIVEGKKDLDQRFYSSNKVIGDVEALAQALQNAKRPLLMVGGGAINANASEEVKALAEKTMSPVICTLMGLGAFPGDHILSLGMPGMHGTPYANKAIVECDFLLSLATRFDDRVAGSAKDFAKQSVRAHIDIDITEIGKRVNVEHYLCGDLKVAIQKLLSHLDKKDIVSKKQTKDNTEWIKHLENYKQHFPMDKEYSDSKVQIKPQKLLTELYQITKGKAIISTDVGQHQMWTAQYYHFPEPRRWLTSGGLGTMGYGLPAAIGAQFAYPNDLVLCVTGDGSYQMCIQELATIRQYNLPIKILLLNNNFLGMVRQWQELFFDERFAESEWEYNPNFVKLAAAYDIPGKMIAKAEEIEDGLEFLLKDGKEPALLEVLIPAEEKVFPMIQAGKDQKDMILYQDLEAMLKEMK